MTTELSKWINWRLTGRNRTICAELFEGCEQSSWKWMAVAVVDFVTEEGHCKRAWWAWYFGTLRR